MIFLTDNPLHLSDHCYQTSCQFDLSLYSETTEERYGITLPENLKTAIEKRKAEYIAGRYCAITSLKKNSTATVLNFTNNEDRSPRWPEGYIGSITHSKGFASAIVAQKKHVLAVGIDSERMITEKTANNIHSHILTETENHDRTLWISEDFKCYLTLIFSAKESIFKCLFPLVKKHFDFRDAKISFDPKKPNIFYFELLKTLTNEFKCGYAGEGQYAIQGNFVHTGIVISPTSTNNALSPY